jgi:hypothetical protein
VAQGGIVTTPLLYRPLAGRHVVAACTDIPSRPCWHAACGTCGLEVEPDYPWHAMSYAEAAARLTVHVAMSHPPRRLPRRPQRGRAA